MLHSRNHRQEKNGNQKQDVQVKCMLDGLDRESSFERGIAEKCLKYLPTEKELVKPTSRRVFVQNISSAELDSKRWRISSSRESRVFGVYTCSFREGSLNAYKQAVVRFPLSFTRHLCVPDHRLSSPVSHAKPSRGPRYLVSMPRKSGEEIRGAEDRVSLKNSLRKNFS